MKIRSIRLILLLCGIMAVPVLGQSGVSEAQNKLLARRAAEADAYRKLAEAVYGVQINSTTFVRDFVAESDEIRTKVDAFIKGVRLGQPRYWDDGVCEVDAEVTLEKLITTLKQIHATHYKGRTVKTTEIEQIRQHVQRDVIQVTGVGAPRPELPPNLPMGAESVITPLPSGYQPPATRPVPGIWRGLPPQARLMAERAAQVDAMRKLLEQIKGLRLNSETLVRDFVTEFDEIRAQASGIVVGAYEVDKYLHHDELIVEVTMAVPVEKVIERIKELHTQHYRGRRVVTTDIVNVRKEIQRDIIKATGSGVPPERFASQMAARGDYSTPAWLGRTIDAVGQAARDPNMPEAQGRLMAERAARMDGVRKLLEQVKGLQITSDTRVADFVARHDQIDAQVWGVLSGAIQDDPRWDGDVVSVRVSIPAADVWPVIHDQMNVVRRRG